MVVIKKDSSFHLMFHSYNLRRQFFLVHQRFQFQCQQAHYLDFVKGKNISWPIRIACLIFCNIRHRSKNKSFHKIIAFHLNKNKLFKLSPIYFCQQQLSSTKNSSALTSVPFDPLSQLWIFFNFVFQSRFFSCISFQIIKTKPDWFMQAKKSLFGIEFEFQSR